ncbi:DNA-processing protein DprA [Hydrogenimonas sp.]
MDIVDFEVPELKKMKRPPPVLYCRGRKRLLTRRKVSIVGTRRPNAYTKSVIGQIAGGLAQRGVVVVSGAAMGVDALAHRGAGAADTIAVLGCGLNHRYPAVNASLIEEIETEGLVLSRFEADFRAAPWSFVVRNEIVVALGEVLVVGQADRNSGTMRSVEFAKRMGKEIFVLPHRLGESEGTNDLLKEGSAEAIYDLDAFLLRFGEAEENGADDLLEFCRCFPTYEETLKRFGDRLLEAELEGRVLIRNGLVVPT